MRKALLALLSDQRDDGASCVSFRVANPCHPHGLSDQLMSAMGRKRALAQFGYCQSGWSRGLRI
jgi:hypothetical protein